MQQASKVCAIGAGMDSELSSKFTAKLCHQKRELANLGSQEMHSQGDF